MSRISVRVQPGAPRCSIQADPRGGWKVKVDAPPVDGAANERLVRFLAREVFGVSNGAVRVVLGEKGRNKVVEVDLTEEEVSERIRRCCKTESS